MHALSYLFTLMERNRSRHRGRCWKTHTRCSRRMARAAEIIHNFGRFVCGRMFSGWTRSCPRGIINTDKCKLNFQQAPCKRARLYLVQTSSAFIKWETLRTSGVTSQTNKTESPAILIHSSIVRERAKELISQYKRRSDGQSAAYIWFALFRSKKTADAKTLLCEVSNAIIERQLVS
jgi:hypothetical protein